MSGSTFTARQAGIRLASAAVMIIVPAPPRSTTGLMASTPVTVLRIVVDTHSELIDPENFYCHWYVSEPVQH